MDANGLRFWMLSNEADWQRGLGVAYDGTRRTLRLASVSDRALALPPITEDVASARLEQELPQVRDRFGTRAYWDAAAGQVMAADALPEPVPIFTPPPGEVPTDLALGHDDILYVALLRAGARPASGALALVDRRERWQPVRLQVEGFTAWRLAPDPAGGTWLLDRDRRLLARLEGQPLPHRPAAFGPAECRPCVENPDPLRLTVFDEPVCPAGETPAGLACGLDGRLALLAWGAAGPGRVRLRIGEGWAGPWDLEGVWRPFSLAWAAPGALAVLVAAPAAPEAPVFAVDQALAAGPIRPVGDLYPLPGHDGGPFLHGLDLPPHYPVRPDGRSRRQTGEPLHHLSLSSFPERGTASGATGRLDGGGATTVWHRARRQTSRPLHHLSLPSLAERGTASGATGRLDSGSATTVWHRLYLEADIPPGCGIRVRLAAGQRLEPPPANDPDWFDHLAGPAAFTDAQPGAPHAVWANARSELPQHPGLLPCAPVPDRTGLFTILIQRATRRVRTLSGRYLHVRVELAGDGRATPELAALRAYASRFSYVEHYLPELYRETCLGPEGDGAGPATPADFLERFLGNFEGVLTPLEDRIAGAYLWTDPRTAPDEALEWLGSWIGLAFDPAYPGEARRRLLANTPALFRRRGTLHGLRLALEMATADGVSGGEVLVLEDFRLRRTFATILGADLSGADNPLLGGLAVSGNSFVGDTLFLGDQALETRQEFLALFADVLRTDRERQAVLALFDRLAYRVTVLVHQQVEPQVLALIRRVVDLESPAHVLARVVTASRPLIVGLASLVRVDTYLATKEPPGCVRLNDSRVGLRDLLLRLPALDPRLEGGLYAGPSSVLPGSGFALSAADARPVADHAARRFVFEDGGGRA